MRQTILLLLLLPGCATWVKGPITGTNYLASGANMRNPDWDYWKEARQDYIRKRPDLDAWRRDAIKSKTVAIGMTLEECQAAWCHYAFRWIKFVPSGHWWGIYNRPYSLYYSVTHSCLLFSGAGILISGIGAECDHLDGDTDPVAFPFQD